MLTLQEFMWYGEGPSLAGNRKAIAFRVLGLPESQQAWIATYRHAWQVLRAKNGVYGEWSGRYQSVEEALMNLR
jgi:hypothetical protein